MDCIPAWIVPLQTAKQSRELVHSKSQLLFFICRH
jgi:hypothetical protein